MSRVLLVVDMQKGVFSTPRMDRIGRVERINQLSRAAERVIFILHNEADLPLGSDEWELLPELFQPEDSIYVDKTACDAFYRTTLADELAALDAKHITICGCATDYCVDTTIKNAASRGYALTIASDAHTTADRGSLKAEQLIPYFNEVWATLAIPGNRIEVKTTADILQEWGHSAG
ncbi:isochorismatase family protein [Hafnia paralvei]|uniref:isochorismatase family protein n=1 Tax=Hafnia paralvei TaxID=546367 RepID=UPI00396A3099